MVFKTISLFCEELHIFILSEKLEFFWKSFAQFSKDVFVAYEV